MDHQELNTKNACYSLSKTKQFVHDIRTYLTEPPLSMSFLTGPINQACKKNLNSFKGPSRASVNYPTSSTWTELAFQGSAAPSSKVQLFALGGVSLITIKLQDSLTLDSGLSRTCECVCNAT